MNSLEDKIDTLTTLMTESHKVTKTYAQATDDSKGNSAEIKAIAQRLDERAKREIQIRENLERKQSAILHNLPENVNTHNEVCNLLQNIGFLPNSTTRISRLGTARQSSKSRPTKIQFHTEVMKIDFMRLFHSNLTHKDGLFITPDLSKEEQNREFKLRQARNELTAKFSENKYRVRSGKLQCQSYGSPTWNTINLPNPTNTTETMASSTIPNQTSHPTDSPTELLNQAINGP